MKIEKSKSKYGDLLGWVVYKMHYFRINMWSILYTLTNKLAWIIKGVKLGNGIRYFGLSKVCRFPGSNITIGSNCTFRSDKFSNLIGINRPCIISTHDADSIINIGNNCGFSGVTIGCLELINIGDNVIVGANVIITDFDWHNVHPSKRREMSRNSKPVIIENNVFIGVNSTVWKGVTIGENSVIGSNSVVVSDIPSNSIAVGNPCRVIKSFESSGWGK